MSIDQIWICTSQTQISLPHQHSEYDVPVICKDLMSREQITDIVMINGPGGFTSLRIGSLISNLIKKIYGNTIRIYDLPKSALYQLGSSILPSQIGMRIGQQKNYRLYDLTNDSHILIQDLSNAPALDMLQGEKYQVYKDRMIRLDIKSDLLILYYNKKSITISGDDLKKYEVDNIQARYYIQPNITPKSPLSF